jgi:hypothetical protein
LVTILNSASTLKLDVVERTVKHVLITVETAVHLFSSQIVIISARCVVFVFSTQHQEESAYRELVTPLEARRQKYLKRRHEHGDRSEDVRTTKSILSYPGLLLLTVNSYRR